MAMTSRLAANVLVAFAMCVLAITLALSVPDISWATMLEALTSGRQAPCPMAERLQYEHRLQELPRDYCGRDIFTGVGARLVLEGSDLSIRVGAELFLECGVGRIHQHVLQVVCAGGDYLGYLLCGGRNGGVLPYEVVSNDTIERIVVFSFQVLATVAQQRAHLLSALPFSPRLAYKEA